MKDSVVGDRIVAQVYRGSRRDDTYLFVPAPEGLERVPRSLVEMMGRLERVMEIELHAGRRLAREDVREVMRNLAGKGYHLQMPPADRLHGWSGG